MAASFGGRLIAALGRAAPYYLPDEYIYPSLARSFAEPRRQLAFAVFAALAVSARIQFAVVPFAIVGAELVADRGRVLQSLRRLWLAIAVLATPPLVLFAAVGSHRVLGGYTSGNHALHPVSLLQWIGREGMLLLYAAGWVLVPGALAGLVVAVARR